MWRQNEDASGGTRQSGPASREVCGHAELVRLERLERIERELAELERELRRHLASWDYAFSMGSRRGGAGDHPRFAAAREHADDLATRRRDLRALIAEHRL
jgi:hypothetical protein